MYFAYLDGDLGESALPERRPEEFQEPHPKKKLFTSLNASWGSTRWTTKLSKALWRDLDIELIWMTSIWNQSPEKSNWAFQKWTNLRTPHTHRSTKTRSSSSNKRDTTYPNCSEWDSFSANTTRARARAWNCGTWLTRSWTRRSARTR